MFGFKTNPKMIDSTHMKLNFKTTPRQYKSLTRGLEVALAQAAAKVALTAHDATLQFPLDLQLPKSIGSSHVVSTQAKLRDFVMATIKSRIGKFSSLTCDAARGVQRTVTMQIKSTLAEIEHRRKKKTTR